MTSLLTVELVLDMDWKSSLEALKSSLPEGKEPIAVPVADVPQSKPCQRLDILLDKKGRKGKVATIVAGFEADEAEVGAIAARLKQKLGVGGSARGGEILIQGDKRKEVHDALGKMGFKCRVI